MPHNIVSVPLEATDIIYNNIRSMEDIHRNYTLNTVPKYCFEPLVGRIIFPIRQLNVPEDVDAKSLIVNSHVPNSGLLLQEYVRVLVFDGQHRHESILALRNDNRPRFDFCGNPLPV